MDGLTEFLHREQAQSETIPVIIAQFLNFDGVGWVDVFVGRRDRHFRFPHTKFSLKTESRY